jgi:hypothetical protein
MRPPEDLLDNIEIVEPPLQELTRRGSFLKRTCLTGCGCLVILIVGIIISVYLFLGTGPKTLKKVPDYFPKNIPLYDTDAIEVITVVPGKYEARSVELAVFFPKVILAPLLHTTISTSSTSSVFSTQINSFKKLWQVAITAPEDYTDTIKIEWQNVDADPLFIFSYYKSELVKNNYQIKIENEDPLNPEFSFSHNAIKGNFVAYKNTTKKSGTNYAVLTLSIPSVRNDVNSSETIPTTTLPNLSPKQNDENPPPTL